MQSITVTLPYIDKFFEMFFDEKWGFPSRKELKQKIEKIENPTLQIVFKYLADNTPMYDPKEGQTRQEAYYEFFERRTRGQKIPLEWISDYGRTNEMESFAEAFKIWVGGAKGKLGPWTRAFFKEIVATGGVNIREDKMNLIDKYLGEAGATFLKGKAKEEHLKKLKAKITKKSGVKVIDRTPKGYGPKE